VEANLQGRRPPARARLQQGAIADDTAALRAADPSQAPAPDPLAAANPLRWRRLNRPQLARQGEPLPVSALPADADSPPAPPAFEERQHRRIPCRSGHRGVRAVPASCVMVCPHAVIRAKVVEPAALGGRPGRLAIARPATSHWPGQRLHPAGGAEDCTGCASAWICTGRNRAEPRRKAINMEPRAPRR